MASGPKNLFSKFFGAVAQLGEHLLCKQGVRSSILLSSTKILRQTKFLWYSSERSEATSRAASGVPSQFFIKKFSVNVFRTLLCESTFFDNFLIRKYQTIPASDELDRGRYQVTRSFLDLADPAAKRDLGRKLQIKTERIRFICQATKSL